MIDTDTLCSLQAVDVLSALQRVFRLLGRKLFDPSFVAMLLMLLWLVKAIQHRNQTSLRTVPGPFLAPFTRLFPIVNIFTGTHFQRYLSWHERYGPIVRTGPRSVSVSDPDAMRQIYGSHAFRKTRMYDTFQLLGNNVFGTRDPAFHRTRKRLIAPVYNQTTLNRVEGLIWRSGVQTLMDKLEGVARSGRVANLFREFMYMTFDVTGETVFGRSFGLTKEGSHPILQWMADFSRMSMLRVLLPLLYRVQLPWLFGRLYESEKKLYAFTKTALEQRKLVASPRRDALQQLIEATDDETGARLTDDEMIPEMLVQMVAGTDTTSITLSWCVHLLLQYPDAYRRLRAEIDAALPERDMPIAYAAVSKLPFLDAVLHETLRLFPPVSDGLPRQVPKSGATVGGHHLPPGTTVFCSAYALHRSSALWDRPNDFVPDRWLVSSEQIADMKRAFIPFSFGPRACLGRNLAWMELKLTISALVRRFDIKHEQGGCMDPIYKFMLTPKDHRVDVRLYPRS
ncbi:cytochrome P450 [Syncephalis pseudoplumigaleata]|uniref:Cytochrome P450 n=1 Tax=Syncephalis pseudoplumigaleata TaxID=1712513 RepID=A0A4V1J1H0_9FUNG|nr:cytochrome P450 [Syncephalis pseudoplumigaleata]|eukprot:RKP25029.1 cytochrome P450 [Syncephalis pseudoplumigaleata]